MTLFTSQSTAAFYEKIADLRSTSYQKAPASVATIKPIKQIKISKTPSPFMIAQLLCGVKDLFYKKAEGKLK